MSVSPFSFVIRLQADIFNPIEDQNYHQELHAGYTTAIVGTNSNRASVTHCVTYDHSSALIGYYWKGVKIFRESYFYKYGNFSSERVASPQTSFGVRLSRIQFSPTSVGEKWIRDKDVGEKWMRDKRTPKEVCGGATERVDSKGLYGRCRLQVIGSCRWS